MYLRKSGKELQLEFELELVLVLERSGWTADKA